MKFSRRQFSSLLPLLLLLLTTVPITAGASPTRSFAQQRGVRGGQHARLLARQQDTNGTIKIETDLVPLRVTVIDRSQRAILGLKKEDFKVYENGVEQAIDFFSAEKSPTTWGLVLDRSGSMMGMIEDVYRAALHVVEAGTDQDETFIVTFNNQTELIQDFSSDRHVLGNSILGLRADGGTALYDAIAVALDHIRLGKHKKKVLVVITDGEDNASRLEFRKLVGRVEEEGVLIYTVGMFDDMGGMSALRKLMGGGRGGDARGELDKIAEVTGARAHFPTDIEGCRQTMKEIAREVSQQYTLGYYPKDKTRDGKWRTIRVVAGGERTGGKIPYGSRTRNGYYAPPGRGGGTNEVPVIRRSEFGQAVTKVNDI